MRRSSSIFRRTFIGTFLALAGLALFGTTSSVLAQVPTATFVLRPHCERTALSSDSIFGEIPAPYPMIRLGTGNCPPFETEDPQTYKTSILSIGDTLDLDIVIRNNSLNPIQHARAWLTYDPTVLQGLDITIDSAFPTITPGERDFDPANGFAMIDASAEAGKEPATDPTPLARIRFKILAAPAGGTPISFHDVQPFGSAQGGHTFILKKSSTNAQGESILSVNPSALHVRFLLSAASSLSSTQTSAGCTSDAECFGGQCVNGVCQAPDGLFPNGTACTVDGQCQSNLCSQGTCQSAGTVPRGGACSNDSACSTRRCVNGNCTDALSGGSSSSVVTSAFALLQVRNLRVTTQGTSAFLAWDPLQSSQLKAYNVYYGTTSGRYIQRKTVDASQRSLTLLDLPGDVMYYFAIRAVSTADEESAFSQEVAVTISDPSSSTSPLVLRVEEAGGQTTHVQVQNEGTIAGETGISSTLIWLLAASAIIGTVFAARRQFSAHVTPPLP